MPVPRVERRHGVGASNFDDLNTRLLQSKLAKSVRPATAVRPPPVAIGRPLLRQSSTIRPSTAPGFRMAESAASRAVSEAQMDMHQARCVSRLSDGTVCGMRKPLLQDLRKEEREKPERLHTTFGADETFKRPTTPKHITRPNPLDIYVPAEAEDTLRKKHHMTVKEALRKELSASDAAHREHTSTARAASPTATAHPTLRSTQLGGLMTTLQRPSTALGLSRSGTDYGTRPSFASFFPGEVPRKATPVPVENETIQAIRQKIYEKAVSVRKAFLQFDTDRSGKLEVDEFKLGVESMGLGLDERTIDGLVVFLDPDANGVIDFNEFTEAMGLKDTGGEYNAFLLERSYRHFGDAPKVKKKWAPRSGKEVAAAFKLKQRIAHELEKRFAKALRMFRSFDEDHNGKVSVQEFVKHIKYLDVQPPINEDEVKNMIEVLQFPTPGYVGYQDFVEHFKNPDKWGHCSAYSDYLPLGQSGEEPAGIDSTTMEKKWKRQGRKDPCQLYNEKRAKIRELIETGTSLELLPNPTPRIITQSKHKGEHLDEFVLDALRQKFTAMKGSSRNLFRLLDRSKEGRISHKVFHQEMRRMKMGIPEKTIDEIIRYMDTDNAGYIELHEFNKVMNPNEYEHKETLPRHDEVEYKEMQALLAGAKHPHDPPRHEVHPLALECERTGQVSPMLLDLVQRRIATKSRSVQKVFSQWDKDRDGFVDLAEMRRGLAALNLGMPHSVIARIASCVDADTNGKLDYNEFVHAFKISDKTGTTTMHHDRQINKGRHTDEELVKQMLAGSARARMEQAKRVFDIPGSDEPCAGLRLSRSAVNHQRRKHQEYLQESQCTRNTHTPHTPSDPRSPDVEDEWGGGGGEWVTHTANGEELFYAMGSLRDTKRDTMRSKVGSKEAGRPWQETARESLRDSWRSRVRGRRDEVLRSREEDD